MNRCLKCTGKYRYFHRLKSGGSVPMQTLPLLRIHFYGNVYEDAASVGMYQQVSLLPSSEK